MSPLEKLTEYFREFPGIGPRQAKRFAYYLMTRDAGYLETLSTMIKELRKSVSSCTSCFRFFAVPAEKKEPLCSICRDRNRDDSLLMIVSRDVDFENIEKSHSFAGKYFILGGTVPILEKEPERRIRAKELLSRIADPKVKEIIIATSANPEGESTATYLREIMKLVLEGRGVKISSLGRGLSTGTELEYSDSDTIVSALKNRF